MCGVVIPMCGVDAVVLSPIGTAFQIACDVTPNKGLSPIGTAYYSGSHPVMVSKMSFRRNSDRGLKEISGLTEMSFLRNSERELKDVSRLSKMSFLRNSGVPSLPTQTPSLVLLAKGNRLEIPAGLLLL
jgi:hypothetical protein